MSCKKNKYPVFYSFNFLLLDDLFHSTLLKKISKAPGIFFVSW